MEKEESILSNISYLVLPEELGEDVNAILTRTLTAVASFAALCKKEECVGRVVIDYSEILTDNVQMPC